jgi:exo-1,4-beta-D-glucosaminidase
LRARLRISSVAFCVAGLCALAAAPGTVSAASAAADRPLAQQAAARPAHPLGQASRPSASVPPAGTTTIGLHGWQVQSTAPATSWTTGSGATQSGTQISARGFPAAGWLPVTPDDAGAVGTEVEALLQNGVCPDDPGLQPVNQRPDSKASVFFSNNMQLCFGAPQTQVGADT